MPQDSLAQDWVGYPEAQRISGLGRRSLRRLTRNGQLRATKIGGATMINMRSLETYMRNHGYAEQLRLFD